MHFFQPSTLSAFLLLGGVAFGQSLFGAPVPREAGAQMGLLGIGPLRVSSARLGEAKVLRLSGVAEHFRADDFPTAPARNLRTSGTVNMSYVPWTFLEAYLGYRATSNSNSTSSPRLLQALGDLTFGLKLSLKGNAGLSGGLHLGGASFVGGATPSASPVALGLLPMALLTWDVQEWNARLPLRWHLNAGIHLDNTKNLVRGAELNAAEEFALGIHRYHRLLGQTALEFPLGVVTPFVEYQLNVPLAVPSEGLRTPGGERVPVPWAMPQLLTFGAKVMLGEALTLLAAVDVGLSRSVAAGVVPAPPWNALVGAAIQWPSLPAPAPPPEPSKPVEGLLSGVVLDAGTRRPLENAIVFFPGLKVSKVATNAAGEFQSHELPLGPLELLVEKPGYEPLRLGVTVAAANASQTLTLFPKAQKAVLWVTVTAQKKPVAAKVTFLGEEPFVLALPAQAGPTRINLPPGRYVAEATTQGFGKHTREIQVADTTEMNLSFDLKPPPVEAPKWVVVTEKKIETLRAVHFETGTDKLHPDSFLLLEAVFDAIVEHKIKKLRIEGHTDNQGGKKRNKLLSTKRAQSVARHLIELGIPRDQLEPLGYGDTRPVAPNLTAKSRELNRRVEFVILKR